MRPATELVHFDAAPGDPFSPTSTPIYQTATFEQASALELGAYDYSRSGNPTRTVLEAQLARLERGRRAFAFASGMAALSAVARLVTAGGKIVAGDDLYGGTCRLLSRVLPGLGMTVAYVDPSDLEAVDRALDGARLLLIETPTNPLLEIADIRALAERAHAHGALLAVDNSLLSPYLQQPLTLGADVVVHSATKFLCGHADVSAGAVVVADPALGEALAFVQNAEGTALSPFESWLLLRGLKTLGVRLDRQQASAARIATFLARHPSVTRVHSPALPDHPGLDAHRRQARGAGSVLSFETGSIELSRRVAESARLFRIAVSFGSVGSVISLPCRMSHASVPPERREKRPLPEDLVRLSVGIEDVDDLLEDLEQALDSAASIAAAALPAASVPPLPGPPGRAAWPAAPSGS